MATMLFLFAGAIHTSVAAEQSSGLLSQLIPEPGYLIAQEQGQTSSAPAVQPTDVVQPVPVAQPQTVEGAAPAPAQETCRVNDVEMPGPCSNYPPQGELKEGGAGMPPPENDEQRERHDRENMLRWKQDKLREYRDQLREATKVRQQLLRLKGSQEDQGKLDAIKTQIAQCQVQLNAATDTEAMKDVLEGADCGDTGEMWEEINRIRQAVELPRELNRLTLDIRRLERTVALKWAKKIVDLAPVVSEIKARHGEAKAAYQAGEYEDAWEIIRDNFHEKGNPGECQGALHMIRGFSESLRRIKDAELKEELQGLIDPIKESLAAGECREARESAEAIQSELGPKIFQLIFDSERRRRAVPDNVTERIERVRQKLDTLEQPPQGAPAEKAPAPQPVQ